MLRVSPTVKQANECCHFSLHFRHEVSDPQGEMKTACATGNRVSKWTYHRPQPCLWEDFALCVTLKLTTVVV